MAQTLASVVTDMVIRKHEMEQDAYAEIRGALTEDFLTDPAAFMKNYGRRPEDLTGQDLREFYPHFLVAQREVQSADTTFRKHFLAGSLFR